MPERLAIKSVIEARDSKEDGCLASILLIL